MKLFLLGATGAIGRHLLGLSLHRGHHVTAYVRAPHKITTTHERQLVVEGNVFNTDQLASAMAGHDIVLSAFGPVAIRASTLRRQFGHTLATAQRQSGVLRNQIVSAAFLFPDIGLFAEFLKLTLFRQMIPDMAGMEMALCRDDLEWTMVRPPRLTNGPAAHKYRIVDGDLPKDGRVISRADVAHFMVGEAETPSHVRQIVGLAN